MHPFIWYLPTFCPFQRSLVRSVWLYACVSVFASAQHFLFSPSMSVFPAAWSACAYVSTCIYILHVACFVLSLLFSSSFSSLSLARFIQPDLLQREWGSQIKIEVRKTSAGAWLMLLLFLSSSFPHFDWTSAEVDAKQP